MSATAHALRELLETRFPGTTPLVHRAAPVAPTGIAALDAALPGGGFARGHLAVWAPGGGVTAVLRTACQAALVRGERAVWIDAARTAHGALWRGGPLLVRPGCATDAAACAEELCRSGGFALVVLAGAGEQDRARVRLTRAVREGGGVLVAVSERGFAASFQIRSRVASAGVQWRRDVRGEALRADAVRLQVQIHTPGRRREIPLLLPVHHHELRLFLDPLLADRRGTC